MPAPPSRAHEILVATVPLAAGTLLRAPDVTWQMIGRPAERGEIVRPSAEVREVQAKADEEVRSEVYGAARSCLSGRPDPARRHCQARRSRELSGDRAGMRGLFMDCVWSCRLPPRLPPELIKPPPNWAGDVSPAPGGALTILLSRPSAPCQPFSLRSKSRAHDHISLPAAALRAG